MLTNTDGPTPKQNIQLVKQRANGRLAVGVIGPRSKITEFVNQIYNYGGTDSGLNYLSDEFLYIHTDAKKLKKSLNAILGVKLANEMMEDATDEDFLKCY